VNKTHIKVSLLVFITTVYSSCSFTPVRKIASQETACDMHVLQECLSDALRSRSVRGAISVPGNPSGSDKQIVSHYIDVWAYLINRALRVGDSKFLKKNKSKLEQLDVGLANFPVYQGIAYRGSEFPPTIKLEKGLVFEDPAFLSTTLDIAIAEHYAGVSGYLSVIWSKSGRVLSYDESTASLSAEKEVLFPRNSRFEILEVRQEARRSVTVIFLVEQ